LRLLRNPAEAAAMGRVGEEIAAQRFEITRQAQRLAALYQEVLDQRRNRKKVAA
jgi:uncharacterized coiled-coil protein SlyX